ncbi:MAG TPA: CPBP family intramembrane glutamic endopeptidase [Thermoanaerobaculia bacterium]|nr:CPBP family intramembrane glutamic endopeptidase [Thermoanaerobaculia bacterium]
MKKLFLGPTGLRAGWGFLVFAVLFTAIQTIVLLPAKQLYRPHRGLHPVDFAVSDGIGFLAALAAAAIMARIEKRRIAEYGLPLARGFPARFGAGLVWGFLPVAATMAIIAFAGGVTFDGWAFTGGELARWAALWAVTMIVLGFFEEYLFRGYPLAALSRGMGFWPAAIVLSIGFGALHYFTKPMESLLDGFSVSLIGLFFCFAIGRTGDLWLAAGMHAAFDYFALAFFGAPNTANGGRPVTGHLLATTFHGPAWLTGGVCGIEASVVMVGVILLMFPLFAWRHRASAAVAAVQGESVAVEV